MNIISLGAGVQSTVMSLMAAHGEITPMPDAAIFADTQWEPRAIYEHLVWLESVLPFPIHRVTAGNIRDAAVRRLRSDGKSRYASIPWFTENGGMGMRQCTKEYKLIPIRRKIRHLSNGKHVRQWIGITTDEAHRMKPSGVQYITNEWPLIDLRMHRRDCVKWMAAHYPDIQLRKSSCLGCPYRSDTGWRRIRNNPDEWADVLEVDRAIRTQPERGLQYKQYMHRSRKPLHEVDLSTAEERGQINMFGNECEGLCGV